QFVEIAREVDKRGVKLLVFDEPTAVLAESEAEQLIDVMRQIAGRGIAIIFITHRLDEVMAAANHITVLRDGRFVAMRATQDTSLVELAELMIGRSNESLAETVERVQPVDEADIALKVRNLTVDMPGEAVCGVDLDVRRGEIFGIGGLAGQGKIGIPNGIMGLFPSEGDVTFLGENLKLNDVPAALGHRLAMVSEDRRGVGLLLDQSIEDNIAFSAIQVHGSFLNNLLPKLKRFRLPKALVAGLCAMCLALFALGIYGIAQFQAAYDTSEWIKAYVAEQKAISAHVAGGLAAMEEPLEETADASAGSEGDVAMPADEPAVEEALPESDPNALFLSERAYESLTPTERRALFFAKAAPFFLGAGFILLAFLFAYRIMTDGSMTQKKTRAIRAYAQRMIKELDIRCTSSAQRVGTLSGGNQQKVCIARALALDPKFLFVSEPTRGIDIGAKKLVLETLVRL
ncbi:MAG TPA: ATP-binding cassette domain-containing protein, partial [Clostridia bacterium]|nr:ATP-binding cassette domain-containing protein [Clostridia bacterium]